MEKTEKYLDWTSSSVIAFITVLMTILATYESEILAKIPPEYKILGVIISIAVAIWNFYTPGERARAAGRRARLSEEKTIPIEEGA